MLLTPWGIPFRLNLPWLDLPWLDLPWADGQCTALGSYYRCTPRSRLPGLAASNYKFKNSLLQRHEKRPVSRAHEP